MARKNLSSVVYRKGRQCFSKAAALPEGCAPHPEDPLVLVVEKQDPALIARALWTEEVKAVIVRPGTESDDVKTLRTRMQACTPEDASLIGQYALGKSLSGQPDALQETAHLSLRVRRQEQNRLSELFCKVAGFEPELGKVLFRPRPEDTLMPKGYGFHDDFKVTFAAIKSIYGPGTDWIKGYQAPEDTARRKISGQSRFYHYGDPGALEDGITVLGTQEGDTLFFFGRDACDAPLALPAFVHSSPPFQDGRADSRMVLAAYTKERVEFPRHICA